MPALLWVGNISLNISLILYTLVYIPQIFHNQNKTHIKRLSLTLHHILYLGYVFDLIYGFANHLPWQYKAVSCIGLCLVILQHIQLIQFFHVEKKRHAKNAYILGLALTIVFLFVFFTLPGHALNRPTIMTIGIIARGLGIIYCLPQIIKNKQTASATAISIYFIYLNFSLASLDTLSAWCLAWDWPNKIASPINMLMMYIMYMQTKKYHPYKGGLKCA